MNCQKCRTPLKLDESLQNVHAATLELVAGNEEASFETRTGSAKAHIPLEHKKNYDEAIAASGTPLHKRMMPAPRRGIGAKPLGSPEVGQRDKTAMSFVVLSDSQIDPSTQIANAPPSNSASEARGPEPTIQRHKTTDQIVAYNAEHNMRMFEILSSRSDIDHPICVDCTEALLLSFQKRLSSSLRERDAYVGFLKELKANVPSQDEVAKASRVLEEAKLREERAYRELVSLEVEKRKLEVELAELDGEAHILDEQASKFWEAKNSFDQKISSLRDYSEALNASISHDSRQLARLERTNVYNDTFFISHDGPFGTINGLRLGRLSPPNNVEWPEINAAWGTTALLLVTVAGRLQFAFRGYTIKPMGSTTYIERIEGYPRPTTVRPSSDSGERNKSVRLDLFSSGDLPLGRQLLHRRFNEAMVAFLECLRQLCEHVRSTARGGRQTETIALPPYEIEKDKIDGVSIKLGASQDESWTTACKYTLTCCKYLLAHISNIS